MELRQKSILEDRMFESRLPKSANASLIFTPLIDVFFLLLIFIILGTRFVYSQGVMIEPPAIDTQSYEHVDKLVIALQSVEYEDGTSGVKIYFNNLPLDDYNQLHNALSKITGTGSGAGVAGKKGGVRVIVLLRANRDVPLEHVTEVMNICRKNRLRLFITTKQKSQ